MPSLLTDPLYWRARAEQVRAKADQTLDPNAKLTLLSIAGNYDYLAEQAARNLLRWGERS
jgi:hypothetical protein